MRFNLFNGLVSVAGQLAFTSLYVESFGIHYAYANILAIASCSMVTFAVCDRLVFEIGATTPARRAAPSPHSRHTASRISQGRRRAIGGSVVFATVIAMAAHAEAAELTPHTLAAWFAYVDATEQRIAAEQVSNRGFLLLDFDEEADRMREALRRGDVLVSRGETRDSADAVIDVPKGAIHHWRGGIFIPGVSLDDVLGRAQQPSASRELQDDVLEARVLEQRADGSRMFLKLRRTKIVTVHYNTEHDIRYVRHDGLRASSRSVATKIAELMHTGTPREEEKPVGNDRGFLWRLNSYWRYEQVEGGVIVECESVSLSRSVPFTLRWLVTPLILAAARESMERTLITLRTRTRSGQASRSSMR